MLKHLLLVGVGGAVGSILRYLTSYFIMRIEVYTFPVATFAVNIVGCFIIGLLSGLMPSTALRLLLVAGFCGGFTTFSTFAHESLSLMGTNQTALAFLYILLSCILGISAVWLGMHIAK